MSSYLVAAMRTGVRSGEVVGTSDVPRLSFGAPVEFKGEEGVWTPEHFFTAAVATCFVNTFESIAEISKFQFQSLGVTAEGILENGEGGYCFTGVTLRPKLTISRDESKKRGLLLLEKAGRVCLISRSILCEVSVEPKVVVR
jgi:organic hydroperoxide reductase OsmC/OhrA